MAEDLPVELQRDEFGRNRRRRHREVADQRPRAAPGAEPVEDPAVERAEFRLRARGGGLLRHLCSWPGARAHPRPKGGWRGASRLRGETSSRTSSTPRASVAPSRIRRLQPAARAVERVAGHRQHLAPLLSSAVFAVIRPPNAQRPPPPPPPQPGPRRFGCAAESAWASGSSPGAVPKTQALFSDLPCKARVFRGIDHVHAARHDGDGSGRQRSEMGGRVDTAGEARDDGVARLADPFGEFARHPRAEGGGVARTDKRHHRACGHGGLPIAQRTGGASARSASACGYRRARPGQAAPRRPGRPCIRQGRRLRGRARSPDARGLATSGSARRAARASAASQKPPEGHHPDPAGANEAEPRQSVIFRGGWGEGWGRKQTLIPRAFASFARPTCNLKVNQRLRFGGIWAAASFLDRAWRQDAPAGRRPWAHGAAVRAGQSGSQRSAGPDRMLHGRRRQDGLSSL